MKTYEIKIDTPIGCLRLLATDLALTGIELPGCRARQAPAAADGRRHPLLLAACDQLAAYFAGARRDFTLPLAPAGTAHQRQVWDALRLIPYGSTTTYGALARSLGRPGAARAIGAANARNPIPVVVPCHRVVGSGGRLTGYAGGLDCKQRLLDLEGQSLGQRNAQHMLTAARP